MASSSLAENMAATMHDRMNILKKVPIVNLLYNRFWVRYTVLL